MATERMGAALGVLQGRVALLQFWGECLEYAEPRVVVRDPKDGVWREAPELAGAIEELRRTNTSGGAT